MSKEGTPFSQEQLRDSVIDGIVYTITSLEDQFPDIEGSLLRALMVEALQHSRLKVDGMGTAVMLEPYESQILK